MDKYPKITLFLSLLVIVIVFPVFADECDICSGNGELTCLSCGGSGEVNCPYCYGTSWIPCSKCYGSGLFAGDKCSICDGVGKIKCKRCDETGKVTCAGCGGSGTVKCPECSGSGVTERVIETTDMGETIDTSETLDTGDTTDIGEAIDIGETTDSGETTDIGESVETPDAEWAAEYNPSASLFDDSAECELKDFVFARGYEVISSEVTPSSVYGRLNLGFTYVALDGGAENIGTAIWEILPDADKGVGVLTEAEIGEKSYKLDEWTFTSYPDYYFWDYKSDWEKTRARTAGWISWKATLASFSDKLPGHIEKQAKKAGIPHRPKKKSIYIVEPDPELYAFEEGDARASLWRRYLELTECERLVIDRDGYYIPDGTVYWWHEKTGVFGRIKTLYILGSYLVSGGEVEGGEFGHILIYTDTIGGEQTLSFYKPDGYGGVRQVWEEAVVEDGIE